MNDNAASRFLSRVLARFLVSGFRFQCEAPGGASVTCPAAATPSPGKSSASPRLCVKRFILALACVGLLTATVTHTYALIPNLGQGRYLTFSSADAFTITPPEKSWNGTLKYSTDKTAWNEFTTAGEHPEMTDCCFANLFDGWANLTSAPELPATALTNDCYAAMFLSCTGLTRLPSLPATNLANNCYYDMFRGCTGIVFSGDTLSITITNAQYGIGYTLYVANDLSQGAPWESLSSIYARTDGPIVFMIPREPTVPRRFFRVGASASRPGPTFD